jgi:hypothetical protein
LTVLAAILLSHPFAELPVADDFSYIHSTQVLAQTGHVTYSGFVSAMLGWQLYLGALFIKLFGFSFTAVRASTWFVAICTAFLCQRTLLRAGIHSWNATIGTLVLVLSPIYVPNATVFLSDMGGLFAVVVCMYCCLRAIQALSTSAEISWVAMALFTNVILGTVRQIAWLGLLVMVPSAVWILRRNRRVVFISGALYILSLALICGVMYWFQHQPYTIPEPLLPFPVDLHVLRHTLTQIALVVLCLILLVLPVALMFVPELFKRKNPWPVYALAIYLALSTLWLWRSHSLEQWSPPFLGRSSGWHYDHLWGALFAVVVAICALALLKSLLSRPTAHRTSAKVGSPASAVNTLLLPFSVAYLLLLLPRAAFYGLWDRYLFVPLLLSLIFLIRFYQEQGPGKLPVAALIFTLCSGVYSVALTHDNFVYHRAHLAALREVIDSGVPATAITGGWDNDGWTELQLSDHVNGPGMRAPKGVVLLPSTHYGIDHCDMFYCDMFPHMLPKYALAAQPEPGFNQFPPVPYKLWVSPSGAFYVVRFR